MANTPTTRAVSATSAVHVQASSSAQFVLPLLMRFAQTAPRALLGKEFLLDALAHRIISAAPARQAIIFPLHLLNIANLALQHVAQERLRHSPAPLPLIVSAPNAALAITSRMVAYQPTPVYHARLLAPLVRVS